MDFVLALHSHLPWVLHHGRWPHGSDWLCEAALDTYLPLIEELRRLESARIPSPVTLGVTPVLANQLAHPDFATEFDHFMAERLRAARQAPTELDTDTDRHLVPLAGFWLERLERLQRLFETIQGDIVSELRRLADADRLELISSAATHGYLPLLGRDESIRLQLLTGAREHERLFGRAPVGCWLPECAYRPQGMWDPPGAPSPRARGGTDNHLGATGFQFFFTDAHLAAAGSPLGTYPDVPLGVERFDAERHDLVSGDGGTRRRSPYRAYEVTPAGVPAVRALVRDPRSSMQVWSRHQGYPGDEWYLEFHKIRWPGGLKLWRVTSPNADLGAKQSYEPNTAFGRADIHAAHFAELLGTIARDEPEGDIVVAPFDTELFGHWWFEGVHFLGELYRRLALQPGVRAVTASGHLRTGVRYPRIQLAEGSWGAEGNHTMWLNPNTAWTWDRLWPLEERFWRIAAQAARVPEQRPLLAAAARQLLLAQSSDWQFIISTGAVGDYAELRFREHCDDADALLAGLETDASASAQQRAATVQVEVDRRDDLFPTVLGAVDGALAAR
jgi:1,4-alpha-glucan branching enzyme